MSQVLSDLRFSLRMMARNKGYAAISIFGLALSISCCILIGMYVFHEVSYDTFHTNKDRLYRITTTGPDFTAGSCNLAFGPTAYKDYPEVEGFCRLMRYGNRVDVQRGDVHFNEDQILYADSGFFDLFSFRLLHGDPKVALAAPMSIVISEDLAARYFADEEAVGQVLTVNKKDYTVTGIIENNPGNSDIQYNALVSLSSLPEQWYNNAMQDWFWIISNTWLKFNEQVEPTVWQAKLDQMSETYVKPWAEENDTEMMNIYHLQPIEEVHFDNTLKFDTPKGNKDYLYIFGLVALFLLLIACINFINLSLAQSTKRAKEIGVRKTLGAGRAAISRQFLTETVLTALLAFGVGLLLVELLIPIFNELTGKEFELTAIFSPAVIALSIGILLFVALAAGSYPAFVLARFEPVNVLKGSMPRLGNVGFVRKSLIVVQFAFSIGMVLGALMVYSQMNFMKGQDLGFEQENVFVFRVPSDTNVTGRLATIQTEMERNPNVLGTSVSRNVPGMVPGKLMFRVEQNGELEDALLRIMAFDEDYIDLMQLELAEGRNFDRSMQTDPQEAFLVNETAVETFGWGDNPIGKRVQLGIMADNQAQFDGRVVGVLKDFHFASLHNEIEPLAVQFSNQGGWFLTVKLKGEIPETVAALKNQWSEFDPGRIQETFFLDEQFNQAYESEEKMLTIFGYFTGLSILISVLGLFAVTSFMVRQRTREMGVRKVLGASLRDILGVISKEFLVLVAIGFVIAAPTTWYFLTQWLEEFAYHTTMGPGIFVAAAAIGGTFAFGVVLWHAMQAMKADPVVALKYE